MNQQLKESYFKAIERLTVAARFNLASFAVDYVKEVLKEVLYIKYELEASIQKEAK